MEGIAPGTKFSGNCSQRVRGAEWSLLGLTRSSPEDKEKGPFTWPFFLASSDMGIPALTGGLGS